jgi:phenylpropionate dioxygenase-like ring-hydroxylating dioxygenase large terminal subunit
MMVEGRPLTPCRDAAIVDAWHVVGASDAIVAGVPVRTRLLEADVVLERAPDGAVHASSAGVALPVRERYGCVWTTLGAPADDLFTIVECDEPDRRNVFAGAMAVHVSAPRAVENFLDMGHFPFVHTGYLGAEPFTEVKPYVVTTSAADGVVATECRFYQPRAQASATSGSDVDYAYRVPSPYVAILHKSAPGQGERMDVICLFLQALDEERVVAYLFGSFLDTVNSDTAIRIFSQLIFVQDKPILENQRPKRLPLDLRAELSVRGDASSIAYRRWLGTLGVTYGTIPVA